MLIRCQESFRRITPYNSKMKITGLIFTTFLLFSGLIHAQPDFRPGYVITRESDTLTGQIDYRDDARMSKMCRFKPEGSDVETTYLPNDIIGFRFDDGKYYVSKEAKGEKVFLEFLINAKVSVFYMKDSKGYHFFLEKEGLGLTEIPYEDKEQVIDEKMVFINPTKHIGVLNYYYHDAPELQTRIFRMGEPDHENMIKLAVDYNNLVSKDGNIVIYQKKIPIFSLAIEPFGGLINYNSKYLNYGKGFEYGVDLHLWMPRSNKNLYFKTGLHYASTDSGQLFKMPLKLQYLYPSEHFRPRASIGVNVYFGEDANFDAVGYLPELSIGFIYKIYKKIYLSSNLNLEYTPIIIKPGDGGSFLGIVSRSFTIGIYIDLIKR